MHIYNISIMRPDEDNYPNALQLQSAEIPGNHSTPSTYPDKYNPTPGGNVDAYNYNSSSDIPNSYPGRPQLSHLMTGPDQFSTGMQGKDASDSGGARYYTMAVGSRHEYQSPYQPSFQPALHPSPVPSSWTSLDEYYMDPNSPSNFIGGSPFSGRSPLTPQTPLTTIEPSPTTSCIPSPGSQGSHEVLQLAPSPIHPSATLAAGNDVYGPAMSNTYIPQHYGSETHLSNLQSYPQSQPHSEGPSYSYPGGSGQVGTVPRRHSHSASERPSSFITPSPLCVSYANPVTIPGRPADSSPRLPTTLTCNANYQFENWYLPGPLVPQKTYRPPAQSDRRRYIEEIVLKPPIYFHRKDHNQPDGILLGISLVDCISQHFRSLHEPDEALFADMDNGPSISIRIVWHGYEPWSRQIPIRNFKAPPGPVTRRTFVKNIAKSISRFVDEHIHQKMERGSQRCWEVGPGKIEFKNLVLLSLHHVSKGSWQANLCLDRPLEQIIATVPNHYPQ